MRRQLASTPRPPGRRRAREGAPERRWAERGAAARGAARISRKLQPSSPGGVVRSRASCGANVDLWQTLWPLAVAVGTFALLMIIVNRWR
jgi:hypothetical protein